MFTRLKNRWNSPCSDENPKIFSKGWFCFVLVCLGILGFMTILALIFGDKSDEIISYLFFGGFTFMLGVLWGIQKAK